MQVGHAGGDNFRSDQSDNSSMFGLSRLNSFQAQNLNFTFPTLSNQQPRRKYRDNTGAYWMGTKYIQYGLTKAGTPFKPGVQRVDKAIAGIPPSPPKRPITKPYCRVNVGTASVRLGHIMTLRTVVPLVKSKTLAIRPTSQTLQ